MKEKRSVGLDLLRIISMLMVVCWHFLCHGGLVGYALKPGTLNWFAGNALYAASMPAVNCFVLLSGYFLCTASFKLKRVVSVWLQTAFYSVVLFAVLSMEGGFSLFSLAAKAIVLTMNRYWFVTAYLLMYMVSPFLNRAIQAMDRRVHFMCCFVLLGICSVLHSIVFISDFAYLHDGYSFLWFCVLYMVAAYIRLYVKSDKKHIRGGFLVYAGVTLLTAVAYSGVKWLGIGLPDSVFFAYNGVLAVTAALGLLMAFRGVSVPAGVKSVVSVVAPLAFGVYLIHDHAQLRPWLWSWLKPTAFADSVWMLPYCLLCVLGIFFVCCLIEWVRQKLFSITRLDKAVDGLCHKMQTAGQRQLEKMFPEEEP